MTLIIEILQHLADEESRLQDALRDMRTCRDVLLGAIKEVEEETKTAVSTVPSEAKLQTAKLPANQAKVLTALKQVESMTTKAVAQRTKLPHHVVWYALGKLVASRRVQLTKLGKNSIWAAV